MAKGCAKVKEASIIRCTMGAGRKILVHGVRRGCKFISQYYIRSQTGPPGLHGRAHVALFPNMCGMARRCQVCVPCVLHIDEMTVCGGQGEAASTDYGRPATIPTSALVSAETSSNRSIASYRRYVAVFAPAPSIRSSSNAIGFATGYSTHIVACTAAAHTTV